MPSPHSEKNMPASKDTSCSNHYCESTIGQSIQGPSSPASEPSPATMTLMKVIQSHNQLLCRMEPDRQGHSNNNMSQQGKDNPLGMEELDRIGYTTFPCSQKCTWNLSRAPTSRNARIHPT
uniref:Uncharacterized protein n=1 Tax=Eutreptiella gymnastica TaxID=73025 RepID=A0A7S4CR73_9EUGL